MRLNGRTALATMLLLGSAGAAAAAGGAPQPWEVTLQPAASPVMERMTSFHDLLLWIIFAIVILVLGLLIYVVVKFDAKRNPTPSRTSHNTMIEVIWTVIPVLILLVIAVPSFRLLYYQNRSHNPEMTLVVHGAQWYWWYEYPDQQITFDNGNHVESRIVRDADGQPAGNPRLLETDNPLVLPVNTDIQILITGQDVMHGFNVPAFGLRTDVVPGRLNETWVRIEREGTYYGQCSQICGTDHAFMPIEVRAVSREAFNQWVRERTQAAPDSPDGPRLLTVAGSAEAPASAAAAPADTAMATAQ